MLLCDLKKKKNMKNKDVGTPLASRAHRRGRAKQAEGPGQVRGSDRIRWEMRRELGLGRGSGERSAGWGNAGFQRSMRKTWEDLVAD